MAIAPIDLQTLFTQLDKVAKNQVSQREGQALHQAIQNVQIQKKLEDNLQQVNEAQNTGEGAEKVNDHGREHGQKQNSGGKKRQKEDEEKEKSSVLSDPNLGRNVDISF
ncbi:MAG: hypothetical protein LBI12_06150 [Treponema sp.]|jgi:hypothetical protein|nr:hypothetical protein [Treponema sp.]